MKIFDKISLILFLTAIHSCTTTKNIPISIVHTEELTECQTENGDTQSFILDRYIVKSNNPELTKKFNDELQLLSENKNLEGVSCDDYIYENYEIVSQTVNDISIKYSYNTFTSKDVFYKYATYDLTTGERITYQKLFVDKSQPSAEKI